MEARIQTLGNVHEVSGPAAIVYPNPELVVGGYKGDPAKPHVVASNDVWIPSDVQSTAALSIYYAYERLMLFENSVFPDSRISWPRKVGFDVTSIGGGSNNAFYAAEDNDGDILDVTAILPYSGNGLAIAYNTGIIAHEHFHAHFYRIFGELLGRSSEGKSIDLNPHHLEKAKGCGISSKLSKYDVEKKTAHFQQAVNSMIFRGWNEGLADFYGALFTGANNFFDESLASDGQRDVGKPTDGIYTRKVFEYALERDISYGEGCNSLGLAYSMGTQVARRVAQHYAKKYDAKAPDFKEKVAIDFFKSLMNSRSKIREKYKDGELLTSWIFGVFEGPGKASEMDRKREMERAAKAIIEALGSMGKNKKRSDANVPTYQGTGSKKKGDQKDEEESATSKQAESSQNGTAE